MASHRISKLCDREPVAEKKQMEPQNQQTVQFRACRRERSRWGATESANNHEPAAAKEQMRSHGISKQS